MLYCGGWQHCLTARWPPNPGPPLSFYIAPRAASWRIFSIDLRAFTGMLAESSTMLLRPFPSASESLWTKFRVTMRGLDPLCPHCRDGGIRDWQLDNRNGWNYNYPCLSLWRYISLLRSVPALSGFPHFVLSILSRRLTNEICGGC
jgi:hypothetical protein